MKLHLINKNKIRTLDYVRMLNKQQQLQEQHIVNYNSTHTIKVADSIPLVPGE